MRKFIVSLSVISMGVGLSETAVPMLHGPFSAGLVTYRSDAVSSRHIAGMAVAPSRVCDRGSIPAHLDLFAPADLLAQRQGNYLERTKRGGRSRLEAGSGLAGHSHEQQTLVPWLAGADDPKAAVPVGVVTQPNPLAKSRAETRSAVQSSPAIRASASERRLSSAGGYRADVVERGWERRDGSEVAEGIAIVRPVRPAEVVAVLAEVVERGWWRKPDPLAESIVAVQAVTPAGSVAVLTQSGERPLIDQALLQRHEGHAGSHARAVGATDASGDQNAAISSGSTTATHSGVKSDELPLFAQAEVVGADVMAELRGGFQTKSGLMVSFGIERVIYVNGSLASTTTLNVSDLGRLVGGSADPSKVVALGASIGVIQNGPNNTFMGDVMSSGAFAQVIQNSLDNQHIQTITTINTQVNSMDLLRANRLSESLRDAVTFR